MKKFLTFILVPLSLLLLSCSERDGIIKDNFWARNNPNNRTKLKKQQPQQLTIPQRIQDERMYQEDRIPPIKQSIRPGTDQRSMQDSYNSAGTKKFSAIADIGDTVYFPYDSAVLLEKDEQLLQKYARWLADNPEVTLRLEGHCDQRGTRDYNLALGERRAAFVRNSLASLGIDRDRLITVSYGKERLVAKGNNKESHQANRRVQLVVE